MSRALDFQIRYGNADELDNYDPMGDVYNNQSFIGGTQYLIFNRPSYDTTTRQTILTDEIGNIQTDRESISKRCLLGNGSNFDVTRDINIGSITCKAWVSTTSSGIWSKQDLTVSGGNITLTSGYYFRNIERYVDGVLLDTFYCEDSPSGELYDIYLQSTNGSLNKIDTTFPADIWRERVDIPWALANGDKGGYNYYKNIIPDSNDIYKSPPEGKLVGFDFEENQPDAFGTNNAVKITENNTNNNPRYQVRAFSEKLTGQYTFSVYLKSNVATSISIAVVGGNPSGKKTINLTTSWQRFETTANVSDIRLGVIGGFFSITRGSGLIIYACCPQMERGSSATNYQATPNYINYNKDRTPVSRGKVAPYYAPSKELVDVYNEALTPFIGKYKFNAFRINNQAAYFDTNSALIPASGTISGYAIDETWGSATFAMSGNAIACTASGSCNGIKLDNGNWYTFSEGIFGDASDYVYDVSGSGVHLQISGQTAAATWQQATGQTDLGYDWRNLYGGHRYRLVDAADDIFIPHVVNTQDVPTESLLPSGYTLLTDIAAEKYVYNDSTWLLASGQVSQYRSELDNHIMNTTPFTESYGHYIRQQDNRWDRVVIYPENLSDAANTLVDFDAQGIDSIVGLTFKVTDIHNLNQVNASYSKKFRLPATQRNNDLFDYIYDPNSANFDTLKEPKDCEVISNGVEILRGKGQVEKTFKKDIATGYDMTVIGDNYNVYTSLDDLMVSGLDFGTFTLNQANVEGSWDYTAASGNVVFAPIDWGNKNFNSFDIADITPSFFIRNILQKGFASAGIGYESSWLDSDYAGRLVMPFNGFWTLSDSDYATVSGYALWQAEDASLSITASGVSTKVYLPITETTSNPNYTASGGYVAANPAKMKILFGFDDLTYDNANIDTLASGKVGAALFGCTFGIEINGQDVAEQTVGGEALEIDTSNIATQSGDVIRAYFKGIEDVTLTNAYFKSEIRRDITEDLTLTLNQYVPVSKDGLTVFDVFKGLADIFNLIAYYDPFAKLLKFEPYADFYSGELDWSEKWNQTKEAQNFYLGDELNYKIHHKYKDDETDFKLTKFGNQNEDIEPYGSYLLELPRNYKKGRTTIENHLFAPTIDYDLTQFGLSIPNIQWNTKDGTQYSGGRSGMIPTNRILYYEGKNAGGSFKMNVGSGFQYSVQEYAYLPRLVFRARSGDSWQSLAMDSFDGKNGAFRTYFEPKYRNIWNGITSIYWLNLTERDIALRPLDKKIYLDGAWWLINQIIDFNPLNDDPTQVELIKLVNYTFNIPANVTPWIDIISGKKFDPVTHKPNNDLPSNGGFDVTAVSGENIKPVDDDYYGVSFGQDNQVPNKSNSVQFGRGLTTYWSNQAQFGTYNEPNENAVFQVGGGTSASGRVTAFEVVREQGQFSLNVGGDRVINDGWHITTSGVKRSSYKQLTGSGTLAGDGTLTIYPTHDATSSGTALFNEITFASAMVTNLNGGGGNADLHFNTLTTTQIDIYATSAHAYDIIYKIEGN